MTWSHLLKIKELLQVKELKDTQGLSIRKAQAARRQNGIWLKHARDLALIHCAFDSMLRVSEIVSLNTEDWFSRRRICLTQKNGKHNDNQESEIAQTLLAADTVQEIKQWLSMSNLLSGILFCSLTKSGTIRIVKKYRLPKVLKEGNVLNLYKYLADKIGESSSLFSCHSNVLVLHKKCLKKILGC